MIKSRFELKYGKEEMFGAKRKRRDENARPRRITHADYTIGWVCALPKEQTAATAMLDKRNPDLPKPSTDTNAYTLGSIGEHNIVIVCLPKGKIGTTSAASVAVRMVNTFPSLKVGLMVGIGGGIPSSHVRLGDVVIGTPIGQYPGVVQWDTGKAEKGTGFKRTGALNNPPEALLTALTKLETKHEMENSKIAKFMDDMKNSWPKLASKYSWSERLIDSLAPSSRMDSPNEINVHYGLIASGNQVIKDEKFRDDLNESLGGNVLCVEMEAAGLINTFPCIVIRGICDYADSRKDKAWQEYAAAIAAACAKEILGFVQSSDVAGERAIKDVLDQVLASVSRTEAGVESVRSMLERQREDEVLGWLTPINYGHQQSDLLELHQEGTGQWLFRSAKYQAWLTSKRETLFCRGNPGTGKTILTALVINELQSSFGEDNKIGIAYIYGGFRRRDQQKLEDLLANLVKQLARHGPSLDIVKRLANWHLRMKTRPSRSDLSKALLAMARTYSKSFIIVDAIDELQVSNGCRFQFLDELSRLQKNSNTNIFATSRPLPDITNRFKDVHQLEILAKNEDVEKYLDEQMYRLPSFVQDSQELKESIKKSIIGSALGMFLLARLNLESLIGKPSTKAIRTSLHNLQSLPSKTGTEVYDHLYNDIMHRVTGQLDDQRGLALRVLSWIIYTRRPLTSLELQHLLAVEIGKFRLDTENLPLTEDMISVCAGLVTVDKASDVIRLVHYTAQDYFNRTHHNWFPTAESDITKVCSTYLTFDIFKTTTVWEVAGLMRQNPALEYASRYVGHHASVANEVSQELITLLQSQQCVQVAMDVVMFIKPTNRLNAIRQGGAVFVEKSAQLQMSVEESSLSWSSYNVMISGLHFAALFGLTRVLEVLIPQGHAVDEKDSTGRTPLFYAVMENQEKAALLLLEKGADINAKAFDGCAPLSLAVEYKFMAIVGLLLKRGAKTGATNRKGQVLLLSTVRAGDYATSKLLVQYGAEINPEQSVGKTILSYAAEGGHEAIVRLLLENGAESDRVDYRGRTPMFYAAENGHESIILLLLTIGTKVNLTDDWGYTPLLLAVQNGHCTTVRLLLQRGAEIRLNDDADKAILSYAAENGWQEISMLLLQRAADIRHTDFRGRAALFYAAEEGHEVIVELLLANGAQVDQKDAQGQTPLLIAAREGHLAVVQQLLQHGATVNVEKDVFGQTPLSVAMKRDHQAVLEVLEGHHA